MRRRVRRAADSLFASLFKQFQDDVKSAYAQRLEGGPGRPLREGMSPARAHFVLFLLAAVAGEPDAMNFVMLLADDLGWADVSPPPYPDKALWRTETPQLERMAAPQALMQRPRQAAAAGAMASRPPLAAAAARARRAV